MKWGRLVVLLGVITLSARHSTRRGGMVGMARGIERAGPFAALVIAAPRLCASETARSSRASCLFPRTPPKKRRLSTSQAAVIRQRGVAWKQRSPAIQGSPGHAGESARSERAAVSGTYVYRLHPAVDVGFVRVRCGFQGRASDRCGGSRSFRRPHRCGRSLSSNSGRTTGGRKSCVAKSKRRS